MYGSFPLPGDLNERQLTGLGAQAFLHIHSFVLSEHIAGSLEIAAAIFCLALALTFFATAFFAAGFFAAGFFFCNGAERMTGFFWAATFGNDASKEMLMTSNSRFLLL